MMNKQLALFLLALVAAKDASTALVEGFSSTLFQEQTAHQTRTPAPQPGVEIELPDFDELFSRIQQTSPLAQVAMKGGEMNGQRGLAALDNNSQRESVLFCLLLY